MEGSEGAARRGRCSWAEVWGPQVCQLPHPPLPAEDAHQVRGRMTQGWRRVSARSPRAGLVARITVCLSELGGPLATIYAQPSSFSTAEETDIPRKVK